MFVFEMGVLIDRFEQFDELPRDYDTRGEKERGDVQGHVDALASQHLRRAADVAIAVYQEQHFEHLSIGAPDEIARELEQQLHPYLRDRLCGRIDVHPGAGHDEIRKAAMKVEAEQERRKEAALVGRLRDAVGAG